MKRNVVNTTHTPLQVASEHEHDQPFAVDESITNSVDMPLINKI